MIEWLRANPDLFRKHPELLDEMKLPHAANAASLIEHQVERLRSQNQELRDRLKTLAGIAGENERLMQRLHQLTLEVMTADSTAAFMDELFERLAEDFNADRVRLHLLTPNTELADATQVVRPAEQIPEWFERLVAQGRTDCGRLTREKMGFLFADRAESIGSAAVVPISGVGVLAIGASAEDRFHPDMGTLFLELLGTTIRYRLEKPGAEHRKRA
jgi:uncharacterized protein YigA (DUF484 family)